MVWLKRLVLLIAGLFALVAMLLAYVMVFVNPNDFKDELKNLAADKANVTLRLDGDIRWSFYPWLGLELENIGVALGSDTEIVQFDRAEFGLALLPLLERKIQVDKVNLVNLQANLRKDAQGRGNWQMTAPSAQALASQTSASQTSASQTSTAAQPNPVGASAPASDNTEQAAFVLPDLQLDALTIENAQVRYRDEQTNQQINATLNVILSDVRWDKAWPMVMDIAVTQSDLQGGSALTANAQLKANLTVFPTREALSLDSLVLTTDLAGDALPTGPVQAKLSAIRLDMDVPQENVLIDGLALSVLGINIDAEIQAYQVLSDPQFSAVLSVGEFNPRTLLTQLKIPLPDMADKTALTKARANITLEGNLTTLTAQPISIAFDDTKIEANAVVELSPLRWDVTLAGNRLDVDRYLPIPVEPHSETIADNAADNATDSTGARPVIQSATPSSPTSAVKFASTDAKAPTADTASTDLIPVELIRRLNGHVSVVFNNLTVKKINIDTIALESTQANGLVTVSPLHASLYEGTVTSKARLNVRGNTPELALSPSINNVQIQPLLVDFMDMDNIAGATFLNGDLSARGNRIDTLMSSLQGDLLIEIKNGALVGTNLTKTVCEGIAAIRKDSLNEGQFGPDTPFETMRFPARIVDGTISTPGLNISSAGIQVTGDGVVSLPNSSLNYQANVALAGSQLDNACRVNETLTKLAFPIVCKGQFSDDPAGLCRPDLKGFGTLFANLAKQELALKLEAEKARLKEKEAEIKARLKEKEAALKAELEERKHTEKARLEAKIAAEKIRLQAEFDAKRKAEEERLKDKLKEKLKSLF
ncbi:AsmA family protein [Marinomonas sp. IMCC 4694]|uniref:AsmA family protein n=1 Tax=Marinomonas sp. IMCC 4694 TaxID=2605432 RepID=UPI0011E74E8B|nr:AsmA family protein [Marinomonas sp. IMCC 4694]TYL46832.1 AsmA family protein [Marinomonas sp. IMCC 4694]